MVTRQNANAIGHSDLHLGFNLQVRATFLVDGMVAGTWKSERKRSAAGIGERAVGSTRKRTKAALEEEGDALLAFLEEDAEEREVRWAS